MKKIRISKLTLKILPKLPLKISQNSCQRFVGKVLLAYSSLFSLPSSIRAISPFFSCAMYKTPKKLIIRKPAYLLYYNFMIISRKIWKNFK